MTWGKPTEIQAEGPGIGHNSGPPMAEEEQSRAANVPPIIFLDMDGVVVTDRSCVEDEGIMGVADPVAVLMINTLCSDFGAKIVVSSTWRTLFAIKSLYHILKGMGFKPMHFYGCGNRLGPKAMEFVTPPRHSCSRGMEINEWLRRHPEIVRYVIFDDTDNVLVDQQENFIQTDPSNGIMYKDYLRARAILERSAS